MTGRLARPLAVALVAAVLPACASPGSAPSGSASVITQEQIGDPADQTAFTVVQRLRANWLRPRTQGTIGAAEPVYAQVYLDELHIGDVYALDRISANQIARIEYMTALDATTRYGTGFVGGLIIVRTIARSR